MVLHADVYGRPKFRLRLSWLSGLVSKEITRGKKKPKKKAVEGKRKRRGRGARGIFEILRVKGLLRQLTVLVRDIFSSLNIGNIKADFRVGLDDPADTAIIFAIIGPAISLLNFSSPYEIRVQPSFGGEAVFEGYSHGRVRLRPIRLAKPFLKFVFSLATVRLIKRLVSSKWKKKK